MTIVSGVKFLMILLNTNSLYAIITYLRSFRYFQNLSEERQSSAAWNFIELCFLTFLSNKSKQLLISG